MPPDRGWRAARACEGGACVEAGHGGAVRDSADPDGLVLVFGPAAWAAFTAALKAT